MPERIRRRPFAGCLAVDAARRREQRVRRIDAFDEQIAGPQCTRSSPAGKPSAARSLMAAVTIPAAVPFHPE